MLFVQEAMSQEGSGEAINQLYLSTVQKYESVKDEYDALRKRYSEFAASHANLTSKLEQAQVRVGCVYYGVKTPGLKYLHIYLAGQYYSN